MEFKLISFYERKELIETLQKYEEYDWSVIGFSVVIHPDSVSCNREYVVLLTGWKDITKNYCGCGAEIPKGHDRCEECAKGG